MKKTYNLVEWQPEPYSEFKAIQKDLDKLVEKTSYLIQHVPIIQKTSA